VRRGHCAAPAQKAPTRPSKPVEQEQQVLTPSRNGRAGAFSQAQTPNQPNKAFPPGSHRPQPGTATTAVPLVSRRRAGPPGRGRAAARKQSRAPRPRGTRQPGPPRFRRPCHTLALRARHYARAAAAPLTAHRPQPRRAWPGARPCQGRSMAGSAIASGAGTIAWAPNRSRQCRSSGDVLLSFCTAGCRVSIGRGVSARTAAPCTARPLGTAASGRYRHSAWQQAALCERPVVTGRQGAVRTQLGLLDALHALHEMHTNAMQYTRGTRWSAMYPAPTLRLGLGA